MLCLQKSKAEDRCVSEVCLQGSDVSCKPLGRYCPADSWSSKGCVSTTYDKADPGLVTGGSHRVWVRWIF